MPLKAAVEVSRIVNLGERLAVVMRGSQSGPTDEPLSLSLFRSLAFEIVQGLQEAKVPQLRCRTECVFQWIAGGKDKLEQVFMAAASFI